MATAPGAGGTCPSFLSFMDEEEPFPLRKAANSLASVGPIPSSIGSVRFEPSRATPKTMLSSNTGRAAGGDGFSLLADSDEDGSGGGGGVGGGGFSLLDLGPKATGSDPSSCDLVVKLEAGVAGVSALLFLDKTSPAFVFFCCCCFSVFTGDVASGADVVLASEAPVDFVLCSSEFDFGVVRGFTFSSPLILAGDSIKSSGRLVTDPERLRIVSENGTFSISASPYIFCTVRIGVASRAL